MREDIAVSVICNAYNHENYIRDALDGFVMQQTNFNFEILVHDDASTDKTAEIIRDYEKKYPQLIKPIYQTENQYSKGNGVVARIQHKRAKGRYIALCEGDDYWTDPHKLQKQFDAMEKNPQIDICAHAAIAVEANTNKKKGKIAPKKCDNVIPAEDVIRGGGAYVATNSLFYRKKIDENMPEFRKGLSLDYTLQIHGALRGGMLYLKDNMSVYRVLAKGSWSTTIRHNVMHSIKHIECCYAMLECLNAETEYKYNDIIKERMLKYQFMILEYSEKYGEMKKDPYRKIYKEMPFIRRLKINIKQKLPIVLEMKKRLRNE